MIMYALFTFSINIAHMFTVNVCIRKVFIVHFKHSISYALKCVLRVQL